MKFSSLVAAVAGTALAGMMLALAGTASAQDVPSYAQQDEVLHGVVASANGFDLSLRDARGFIDRVKLHQGTVIRPRGLTLAAGQTVTIYGYSRGDHFDANEIDTPYRRRYAYYAYPGPYYAYPGPYYGYPYGPSFGFGLGFHFR